MSTPGQVREQALGASFKDEHPKVARLLRIPAAVKVTTAVAVVMIGGAAGVHVAADFFHKNPDAGRDLVFTLGALAVGAIAGVYGIGKGRCKKLAIGSWAVAAGIGIAALSSHYVPYLGGDTVAGVEGIAAMGALGVSIPASIGWRNWGS